MSSTITTVAQSGSSGGGTQYVLKCVENGTIDSNSSKSFTATRGGY